MFFLMHSVELSEGNADSVKLLSQRSVGPLLGFDVGFKSWIAKGQVKSGLKYWRYPPAILSTSSMLRSDPISSDFA